MGVERYSCLQVFLFHFASFTCVCVCNAVRQNASRSASCAIKIRSIFRLINSLASAISTCTLFAAEHAGTKLHHSSGPFYWCAFHTPLFNTCQFSLQRSDFTHGFFSHHAPRVSAASPIAIHAFGQAEIQSSRPFHFPVHPPRFGRERKAG